MDAVRHDLQSRLTHHSPALVRVQFDSPLSMRHLTNRPLNARLLDLSWSLLPCSFWCELVGFVGSTSSLSFRQKKMSGSCGRMLRIKTSNLSGKTLDDQPGSNVFFSTFLSSLNDENHSHFKPESSSLTVASKGFTLIHNHRRCLDQCATNPRNKSEIS